MTQKHQKVRDAEEVEDKKRPLDLVGVWYNEHMTSSNEVNKGRQERRTRKKGAKTKIKQESDNILRGKK